MTPIVFRLGRYGPLLAGLLLALIALPQHGSAGGLTLDGVRDVDVVRGMSVSLDPARQEFTAEGWFRPPGDAPFSLKLSPDLAIRAAHAEDGERLNVIRTDRGRWEIADAGAGDWVRIEWRGELPSFREARGSAMGGRPLAHEEGAFLAGSSGWFPEFDDQEGPSLVHVRVPEPYRAVVTGELLSEESADATYSARFVTEGAHRAPSLFAGPWQIRELEHDGLTLRAYLDPEQGEMGDEYLALSAQYIDEFSEQIGEYPFSSFSIVSAPIGVGLGYPGLTYVGRTVLPLPFFPVQSLAHEILHNWWGNAVLLGENGGNWSEGLTTYLADHAMADRHRENGGREMRRDWLRDYAAMPASRDLAVADFRSRGGDPSLIIGYSKTAYLFHMLRQELGDEMFRDSLRTFWDAHRFSAVGWPELITAFEAESGRDLKQFFEQWLERPGAPSLTVRDVKAAPGDNGGYRLDLRLSQEAPAYALRVPLEVLFENGERQRFHVRLDNLDKAVSLDVDQLPAEVLVDPDHDLFRRLTRSETPPIMRDLTLAEEPRVTLASGDNEALEEVGRRLANRLFQGNGRISNGGDAFSADEPFTIIGATDAVASLLEELGLDPQPPEIAGRGTASAWTQLTAEGQPVLAIAADNEDAMRPLMRSLPRQVRQSWLVFSGNVAIGRGVWSAEDEPLRQTVDRRD